MQKNSFSFRPLRRILSVVLSALLPLSCSGCIASSIAQIGNPEKDVRIVVVDDPGIRMPERGGADLPAADPSLLASADADLNGDGVSEHYELRDGGTYGVTTLFLYSGVNSVLEYFSVYTVNTQSVSGLVPTGYALIPDAKGLLLRVLRSDSAEPSDFRISSESGRLKILCADEFILASASGAASAAQTDSGTP